MRRLRSAMVGAVLLMASGMIGVGQLSQQPPVSGRATTGLPSIDGRKQGDQDDPLAPALAERQERSRNSDRQKKLVEDTNKLLSLATDLKQQVDKNGKDATSADAAERRKRLRSWPRV